MKRLAAFVLPLALASTACAAAPSAGQPAAAAAVAAAPAAPESARESFADFHRRMQAAALALMNGDTKPWEAIYSHAPDATLFGGWGGPGEKGWEQLTQRWQMVAGRYRSATLQIEPITEHVGDNLAVTVELWRGEASFSDGSAGPIGLRVTQVFRRENGEWRLVHRQADEQLKLQPIKSHLQPPEAK